MDKINDSILSVSTIQWFPGHMTKALRMMEENIKLVDAVVEVLDARIPFSSSNPQLNSMISGKPKLILLNKSDLADPNITAKWLKFYSSQGYHALAVDSQNGKGTDGVLRTVTEMLSEKLEAYAEKGQIGRTVRIMIVGIPNVGKSSLINRLARRKVAIAGDKPGVTKGKQWIKLSGNVELLDTPGVLWPKFDSQITAEFLAVTNAIKVEILDIEAVASDFIGILSTYYPERLLDRYKVSKTENMSNFDLLEAAAKKRGFIVKGGVADTERMARTLLNEYQAAKLGKISLESPYA